MLVFSNIISPELLENNGVKMIKRSRFKREMKKPKKLEKLVEKREEILVVE